MVDNLIDLSDKETRRRIIALTKCASEAEDRPVLNNVLFDGTRAVAMDSYIMGILPFHIALDEPVMLPAKRLAAALKLPTASDPVFLRFDDHGAVIKLGEDVLPLDDFDDPTTITISYWDDQDYPDVDRLLAAEPDPPDGSHRIALSGERLARVAALSSDDHNVILSPRGKAKAIDVIDVSDGARIGLVMPLRVS